MIDRRNSFREEKNDEEDEDEDDDLLNDEFDQEEDSEEDLGQERLFLKKLYTLDIQDIVREERYEEFSNWLASLSLGDFVAGYYIATDTKERSSVKNENMGVIWFKYTYGVHIDSEDPVQPHYEMLECRIPNTDQDKALPEDFKGLPIFHFVWEDFKEL